MDFDGYDDDVPNIFGSDTLSSSQSSDSRPKCPKKDCQNLEKKYETVKSRLRAMTNEIEKDIVAFERCTRSGHPDPVEVKRLTDNIRDIIQKTENSPDCDQIESRGSPIRKRRFDPIHDDPTGDKRSKTLTDPHNVDETRVTPNDDTGTFANESHDYTWHQLAVEVIDLEPVQEVEIPATNNVTSFDETQLEEVDLDSSVQIENSATCSSSFLENDSRTDLSFSENMSFSLSSPELVHNDDDDQNSDENLSPLIDKILKIELVVQKILAGLNLDSLKICRLLSIVWLRRATNEICQRSDAVISFHFDRTRCQYLQQRRWLIGSGGAERKRKSLFDLNRRVSKSKRMPNMKFPIQSFRFCRGHFSLHDYKTGSDLRNFFEMCGPFIKKLSLLWSTDLDKYTFRHFLTTAAPNLTSLTLLLFTNIDFETGNPEDDFMLPNLRIVYGDPAFVMLSRKAPNLTHALNLNFENLPAASLDDQDSRVHTIKKLFCQVNPKNVDKLAKLSQALPRLTSFHFSSRESSSSKSRAPAAAALPIESENWAKKAATEFEKILESSKNSLKILKIGSLPKVVDFLQIPSPLKNLHTLCLRSYEDVRVFPAMINLPATFPHLRRLDVGLGCDKDERWDTNFPPLDAFDFIPAAGGGAPGDCLPTVFTLTIRGFCSTLWLKRLKLVVPHVRILELSHGYKMMSPMLRDIWRIWRNLTQLTIKCGYFEEENHNLDAAFTGLPENICKRLRARVAIRNEAVMDKLRQVNPPSIRGLKGLERLNIIIRDQNFLLGQGVKRCTLISIISALYAFSLMPKLKVTIFYDHFKEDSAAIARDLTALTPYVDMIHWSDSEGTENRDAFVDDKK